MHTHAGPFPVIQTGAAQFPVLQLKTQRLYQVQGTAGIRTKAYDIARVRGYLRLVKHHMEHQQLFLERPQ
jgi:hypothetical protein